MRLWIASSEGVGTGEWSAPWLVLSLSRNELAPYGGIEMELSQRQEGAGESVGGASKGSSWSTLSRWPRQAKDMGEEGFARCES